MAVVVMIAALGCASASASAATETVPLGYKQHTGPNPFAFFTSDSVERAVSFEIAYSADPVQQLIVSHRVSCDRGPESVTEKSEAVTITPPLNVVVLVTMVEPDSCWISVDAETPYETALTGTVRIDVTATRTSEPPPAPYWRACRLPGWLASGYLKVHGKSLTCAAAKKISRRAWIRPEREGYVVHVGKFFCSRSGSDGRVVVNCSHASERFKLAGRKPTLKQFADKPLA
jgi:hypothetical protein